MLHDTFIKVGDRTFSIKADRGRRSPAEKSTPQVLDSKAEVKAKVVEPPEKRAVRKSSGAETKGT